MTADDRLIMSAKLVKKQLTRRMNSKQGESNGKNKRRGKRSRTWDHRSKDDSDSSDGETNQHLGGGNEEIEDEEDEDLGRQCIFGNKGQRKRQRIESQTAIAKVSL